MQSAPGLDHHAEPGVHQHPRLAAVSDVGLVKSGEYRLGQITKRP